MNAVEHPAHYTAHPSGVEIYLITQEMWCPNLANAFKYMARYTHKDNPAQDILKAAQYVKFEMNRRYEIHNGNIPLPRMEIFKYEPRFQPFYLYIAGEPDKYLSPKFIRLWNADKNDSEAAESWLRELHQWLLALAKELEERATKKQPEQEPADLGEFKFEIGGDQLIENWEEFQVRWNRLWRSIIKAGVNSNGEWELQTYGVGALTFSPGEIITLRKRATKEYRTANDS